MTREHLCDDCPSTERRIGERRQAIRQSFLYCARFVGVVVATTSLVSIGAAVSISSAIAHRADLHHHLEVEELRELVRRLEQRIVPLGSP